MKTPSSPPRFLQTIKMMAIAAGLALPVLTASAQSYWSGGTADFNNAADWSGSFIDGSDDASPNPNLSNDSGSNNVVLIQAGDPVWYHGDTLAGNNSGTSGSYLQTGGTNETGYPHNGNWLRMGVASGTYGSYILSNGWVDVAGHTQIGENGYGYLEIDGGVYTTGHGQTPGIVVGQGDFGPGTGELVINGGTITNFAETWFGEGNNGNADTGNFLMTGGTYYAHDWFVFGRNNIGTGYGTMTGGSLIATGGNFLIGGGGYGSFTQTGGSVSCYVGYLIPQSQGSTGFYNIGGNATLNSYSWMTVGRGGPGTMTISNNAVVNHNASGTHFDIGAGGDASGTGPGVLNQYGGTINELSSDFWMGEVSAATYNLYAGTANLLNVVMSVNNGIVSTLNLSGGTLNVNEITSPTGMSSLSTLNLNSGILRANGNNSTFINNLVATYVGGSVTIDTQGYTVTIPQALADAGGGSITKVGSGDLILTGANNYAGTTTVSAGTLETTTASTGAGPIVTADGTTFQTDLAAANGQLAASALTVGASSGATLNFNLGSFGTPTAAAIAVSGAYTANGTITVNVSGSGLGVATIPLISYGSTAGSPTYNLASLPPGVSAHLATVGSTLSLVVTSSGEPRWNGNVLGDWDTGTNLDWYDLITMAPTAYSNGKPVLFDDNATGTTTVNLTVAVSPGSITFNNSVLPYTITGSGSINGTTGLTVNGATNVTIANTGANTFTGPVALNNGFVTVSSLGNGGSSSALGASSASPTNLVLAGGTLNYTGPAVAINRGYSANDTNGAIDLITATNLAFGGQVSDLPGSGFLKSGLGQLAYTGSVVSALADSGGYGVEEGSVLFGGTGTNNIGGTLAIDAPSGTNSANLFPTASASVTNGTVNIYGSLLDIGDIGSGAASATGTFTQTGGTVDVANGQIFVGEATNNGAVGTGTYNLSGGTLIVNNWFAVGRKGGIGTLNLSGSAVINDLGGNGGNIDIGTSGGFGGVAGTGVLNQSGGTITAPNNETWLGEGAGGENTTGTWNMTGGSAQLGEFHIGVGGTGTSTFNISGSATVTSSYLLLANYDPATTANMNVGSTNNPGGTVTVNADVDVGGAGTSTLNFVTNGGGVMTCTGTMYLSRFNQTAFGTVNLNAGGTLIAAYINNGWGFNEHYSSPLDNPNAFNFNGGTLRAYTGSGYFIQPYVNAVVQGGGAIIDNNGFDVEVQTPLVSGGGNGGLTALGSGVLVLNGPNSYTGTTVVSAGTLALDANGSILGPVVVQSGATLAGDIGTIKTTGMSNSLTLQAGSTTFMTIAPASSSDTIVGLTSVSYGGALVVTNNSGSALTAGQQYQLFSAASAGTGNFSSVTILPSGSGTFNPATGILTIGAATPPVLSAPKLSGGNLILTGSNGVAGAGYTILSTTNLALPLSQWTTNTTGTFATGGTFSNAIPATNNPAAQYFDVRTP